MEMSSDEFWRRALFQVFYNEIWPDEFDEFSGRDEFQMSSDEFGVFEICLYVSHGFSKVF